MRGLPPGAEQNPARGDNAHAHYEDECVTTSMRGTAASAAHENFPAGHRRTGTTVRAATHMGLNPGLTTGASYAHTTQSVTLQ